MSNPHNFSEEHIPKSDLLALKKDILDQNPDAALPCNLSDEWLTKLARDLEMLRQEPLDNEYLNAPLAIVVRILHAKNMKAKQPIEFSIDELSRYLQDLHIEISLEIVRRNTKIAPEPATLETIFTNRDISFE